MSVEGKGRCASVRQNYTPRDGGTIQRGTNRFVCGIGWVVLERRGNFALAQPCVEVFTGAARAVVGGNVDAVDAAEVDGNVPTIRDRGEDRCDGDF